MEKQFSARKDLRVRYHLAGIRAPKSKKKRLEKHKCQNYETNFRLLQPTK
jgi:hypothetical protein